MNGSKSGLVHGTPGTQLALDQSELQSVVTHNEMTISIDVRRIRKKAEDNSLNAEHSVGGKKAKFVPIKRSDGMRELDLVRLKQDFEGLSKGTVGIIVLEYDGTAFEVEFFDDAGNTIDVLTTPAEFLELVTTE